MVKELFPNGIRVNSKDCMGCLRHEKDIMITLINKIDTFTYDFTDVFLDNEQAEELIIKLQAMLERNKEEDDGLE